MRPNTEPAALRRIALLDEEALVAAVRAGDDTAFSELHRRYAPRLLRFATRLLANSGHDPQDVVQESLIRAHRALQRDERPVTLGPWLHVITRRCAIDQLRRATGDPVPDEIPSASSDPSCAVMRREELRRVVAAVAALPSRQREALTSTAFGGEPYEQIASRMDTSVPAIKALVFRARAELAQAA